MRTLLAGNNKLACDALNWLINRKEEVIGIVSENRDTVKRDEGWEKPFFEEAKYISEKQEIPFYSGNINDFPDLVSNLKPEVICFCRYIALIKPEILNIPKKGCTNLHYGELPKYGGCSPIAWAIKNGEDHIGITLHYMSEKFDEGEIIDQRSLNIASKVRDLNLPGGEKIKIRGLTGFEAYQEANNLAFKMFQENYPLIKQGRERKDSMDLSNQLYYKKGALELANIKYINLNQEEEDISREFRTFFFPYFRKVIGLTKDKKEILLELK